MAWNTAVAMSTARLMPTARMPSRDRLIEGSISPCECPCSTEAVGFGILTDLSGGPAPHRSPRRAARKRFAARSDVVGANSSPGDDQLTRSEEDTSELQLRPHLRLRPLPGEKK